jgi:hypothetical protein
MKKTEIRKKIDELEKKRLFATSGYQKISYYKGLREKISLLENESARFAMKWRKVYENDAWSLDGEISSLSKALREPSRRSLTSPLPESKLTDAISKLIRRWVHSIQGGGGYIVFWRSDSGRTIMLYVKGGSSYVDRMTGSKYFSSETSLIDVKKALTTGSGFLGGVVAIHQGRLSKKVFDELVKKSEEYEKTIDLKD